MRPSSSSGFDLREAVDSLRDTLGSLTATRKGGDGTSSNGTSADSQGADRRDIRAAILIELSDEPMHGYQIIRAIETRSGGAWKPTPGSVYPTLQLLADEELVVAAQVGERKVYSLTAAGRIAAAEAPSAAEVPSTDEPGAQQRGQGQNLQSAVALTKSGVQLAQALTQVAQIGTSQQSERAVAIIDEARRKLYAILAED